MKTIRCLQKDIPQNINFLYDLSALAIYKTAIPPHILTPLIQRLILNGVEAIGEELGEISVTGAFQDGAVTIFVRNTGKLPKKNMPKLFVAFWTTKPNHLGVGLYNARRVLRRYDASLRYLPAESGTCFAMTLPVIDDAPSAKIIPLRIGGNERVLYIDDEYESCEKLKALIHQFGYDTSTATHVEDALIRIASGDEYDVIVLNAANPSMPCGAFLRELSALGYKGKVVLVDDPRLSPAAETVLIAAQIPRPYSIVKLVRTIRQVIDGERRLQHEPNHIVL
jgi:CheY-like chemotaxis protein